MNGPASKALVPKLRFPGFSVEWQAKELGSITKWSSGGTPAKDNPKYWGGDIPWISAASMYGSTFSRSERTLTELGARSGTKVAKQGSLLLLVRGSMLFNTVPVGIAGRDVAFNQDVKAITSDVLDNKYLLYFFQASEHKLLSKVVGTGIGAGKLDMEDMYGLTVAVPPLDEQQKIAEFLTAVDDRIGLRERKLELLKKYKQGVMQKIFTQQIRFKDTNGKGYPNWVESAFGEIATVTMGQSPSSSAYNTEGNGLPLIQGNADIEHRITFPRFWTTETTKVCDEGDIILTVRAPSGYVAVANVNACIGRGVCSIKPKATADIEFIYQFLLWFEPQWVSIEQGSTFNAISGDDIRSLKHRLPSLDEQHKIAGFLTILDDKIKLEESKLEQAKIFKKSLLQQMFV